MSFSQNEIEEAKCNVNETLNERKIRYEEKFCDHLLQEYTLYVSSMQHATDKRIHATTWYVTILSLLTILLIVKLTQKEVSLPSANKTFLILPMICFLLCILWYLSIRSCNDLIYVKLVIIKEIEKLLPFGLYTEEWKILQKINYNRLSKIDSLVPIIVIDLSFWWCFQHNINCSI